MDVMPHRAGGRAGRRRKAKDCLHKAGPGFEATVECSNNLQHGPAQGLPSAHTIQDGSDHATISIYSIDCTLSKSQDGVR